MFGIIGQWTCLSLLTGVKALHVKCSSVIGAMTNFTSYMCNIIMCELSTTMGIKFSCTKGCYVVCRETGNSVRYFRELIK